MGANARRIVVAAGLAIALSSCATYSMPAVRLESPEASGRVAEFDLELVGLQSGADLLSSPSVTYPDLNEETGDRGEPVWVGGSTMKPAVGGMMGITPKFEAGLRFSPHHPLTLRLKYQFAGEPATTAPDGGFSAAFVAAPGITMGRMGGSATSYFLADLSVPLGYRLNKFHLVTVTPFFTLGSISGVTESAADIPASGGSGAGAATDSQSLSASQFGAGLGYQLSIQYLFVRAEVSYSMGTISETKLGGIGFGILMGLRLN